VGEILESVGGIARRRAVRSALSHHKLAYLSGLAVAGVAMTGLIVFGRSRSGRAASATRG